MFVLGLVGRVFVSIIIAKYNIFPRDDNGRSRESDLRTYTEFGYVALLAML